MTHPLPHFPYHPDPVATGAVVPSEEGCVRCGQARGFLYSGPVYTGENLDDRLCPWCIADGSAAERYDAHFTGGFLGDRNVDASVREAVDRRTPGFSAWQEPQWFFHCGDGAAFLGCVGAAELADHPEAIQVLREEAGDWGWPADQVEHYLASLDKDGEPTAYLFRCRVCGTHLAFSDFS
ncbi:CbrC family protein [Streptomyces sp. NPDC003077]|uniref:CbrC family protein n=1 Tax=Streptomyces sp. NPDC003077 TaxID=3154443 RepID=UPI0033ACF6D9